MIVTVAQINRRFQGRLQKKKSKKSDIVTKGRVGWAPKPYFQEERNSDKNIG